MKMRATLLLLLSMPVLAEEPAGPARPQATAAQPRRVITLDEVIRVTRGNQWQLRQAHENTQVAVAQADVARGGGAAGAAPCRSRAAAGITAIVTPRCSVGSGVEP